MLGSYHRDCTWWILNSCGCGNSSSHLTSILYKTFLPQSFVKNKSPFSKSKVLSLARTIPLITALITDPVKGTPLILKAPLSFFKVRNGFFVKRGYFVSISIYCGILTDCKSLLLLFLRLCSEFVVTVLVRLASFDFSRKRKSNGIKNYLITKIRVVAIFKTKVSFFCYLPVYCI